MKKNKYSIITDNKVFDFATKTEAKRFIRSLKGRKYTPNFVVKKN